jgi:hypothetical protein
LSVSEPAASLELERFWNVASHLASIFDPSPLKKLSISDADASPWSKLRLRLRS